MLKRENFGVKITAHIVMILFTAFAVLPFLMLVSSSFTSTQALTSFGYGLVPRDFSLAAYQYIFKAWSTIGKAYLVTFGVTVVGTIVSLVITTMFAYGLSLPNIPFKKLLVFLLILSLLFNGGATSSYLIYTRIFKFKNSIFSLLIPNLLMNGFTVILVLNYFRSAISKDFAEAAEIDGAGYFRIFWQVYLPLATPILATVGLTIAIGYWNDWSNGLYYIDDQHSSLYSIQLLLNRMQQQIEFLASNPDVGLSGVEIPSESVRMGMAVIGILPLIIAYPFFQKYFAAGISLGGVKG